MSFTQLGDRKKSFLLISALAGVDCSTLLPFLPASDHAPLEKASLELASIKKDLKREAVISELKRLSGKANRSILPDIHPDWILEALIRESPRMMGLILRYLPGDQAHAVLEKLPENVLKELPPLTETFSVSPDLVSLLKRRFEKQFLVFEPHNWPAFGSFDSLALAPAARLEPLFRELGFREMAMAFTGLNIKIVELILKRLPPRDAALLKLKIERLSDTSKERSKKAQSHLLSLDLEKGSPDLLVLEMGLFVLSRGLTQEKVNFMRLICQKFPMKVGKSLRRYAEKNLPHNSAASAQAVQREIMEVYSALKSGS